MEEGRDNKDIIKKAKEELLKEGIPGYYYRGVSNILQFYKKFYEIYYELITSEDVIPKLPEEYLKALQEDYEKKMKELENKYIPIEIEVKVKEGDKIINKKITVNVLARRLIEAIVYRFGIEIFNYLAIHMPPPELYLLIIQNLTSLTRQVKALEGAVLSLTENMIELTENLYKLMNKKTE